MKTMFSTLLQLPLFQGLNQEDFTNILGKVKFHFSKHKKGEVIIKEGSPCHELIFLLQGKINSITISEDTKFSLIEKLETPYLIEPYSLFGMETHYRASYIAYTDANTVRVDKSFILKELFKYEIFRINYANNICNRVQNFYKRSWDKTSEGVEEKIIRFILSLTDRLEGEKILKIKMEDLAQYIDDTRLNVSKALNELQSKGIIQLNRKEISIPDGSKLV